MASSSYSCSMILGFSVWVLLTSPVLSLTCTSQTLKSNEIYSHCLDLPALTSYLHFTYNASSRSLSIAFLAKTFHSEGWVAWAVNPTGHGMVGAQSLVAYKDSDGAVAFNTYNISSYGTTVAEKLSFDIWDTSAEESGEFLAIYGKIKVPEELAKAGKLNHLWQVGHLASGELSKHEFSPANLLARGTLDLSGVVIGSPPKEIIPIPNMGSNYNSSMHRRKKHLGVVIGVIAGICVMIVGLIWFIVLRWKRKRYEDDNHVSACVPNELEIETGPKMFSYGELATATSNFAEKERLGEGGFGAVYKGFLKNLNIFVAVKKISGQSKQGIKEYAAEIKIISRLRHKNTVKLIGWCHVKELMLVYEFMPNGSLDSHLFKGKSLLTWEVRYKIVQDIASALLYLHEEGDDCVLHRDIKSSNIMLDADFNAKLGDFGLARLVDHAKGSQTTGLAGTFGYMAPECFTATNKASKKSDVYGFGVVALEIACGRRSVEHKYEEDQVSLVPWVWEAYGNGRHLDTADKKLCMNFDMKEMERLLIVGLWCAHPDRSLRPCTRQVIQVLNFELSLPNLPPKMPIPKYDVPIASVVTSSCEPSLSLTILR